MPVSPTRHLIQKGTGHLYVWTPALALRGDMQDFDSEIAKRRTEALKVMLAERETQAEDPVTVDERNRIAAELAQTAKNYAKAQEAIEDDTLRQTGQKPPAEEEVPSAENDMVLKKRQDIIKNDAEIKRIQGYRSKNQIEQHMLIHYGTEIDRDLPLEALKKQAFEARVNRMFEVPVGDQTVAVETQPLGG